MTIRFPEGGVGPGCGPDDEVLLVEPGQWRAAVADTLPTHPWFESLTAVDEILRPTGHQEQLRVIARFLDPSGPRGRQLHVRVPRDLDASVLDSIVDLVAGAAWYEREVHDFFGVTFVGGDPRPLLWHGGHRREGDAFVHATPAHPLRKDALLSARVETPWPGAKDADEDAGAQASRRRTRPPGVPDPDLMADPGATATEVVTSLSGGRVRRRR